MTGHVVVDPDDDTLRDQLARVLAEHATDGIAGNYVECRCGEEWDGMESQAAHQGDVLRAALRDVGTPATTEERRLYGRNGYPTGFFASRLVTDWTET